MNAKIASDATVDHAAQAAIHGGKKGHTLFKKTLKGLTNGGTT